jgi:hypothetical protein
MQECDDVDHIVVVCPRVATAPLSGFFCVTIPVKNAG